MKRLIIFITILLFTVASVYAAEPTRPYNDASGCYAMTDKGGNDIPDTTDIASSGSSTYYFATVGVKSVFFDVEADQGLTVIVTPLVTYSDGAYASARAGAAADTQTISADTPTRMTYTDLAAPWVKAVVTNTGGSTTTDFFFRACESTQ